MRAGSSEWGVLAPTLPVNGIPSSFHHEEDPMKMMWWCSGLISCLILGLASPAKALEVEILGQVNHMVMWADDGDQDDFFVADNDNSSTRIRFQGEETFDAVKTGIQIEIEAQRNASNTLTIDRDDDGTLEWNDRWLNVYFGTPFGRFEIGKGDGAANNSAEQDLSGTGVIIYSDTTATAGSFIWKNSDGTPFREGTTIGATRSNFDGLSRNERLRYSTPSFAGLFLAASVTNGQAWETGLWYAAELYGKLAAAIAYVNGEDRDAFDQWSGSISWLAPFGLNLTFAYGLRDFDTSTNGRAEAENYYGKVGYKFDIHAISIEYGLTEDLQTEGDDSSHYGLGYVIMPWEAVELYAAYRNYMLDVDTGSDPEDFRQLMAGTRIKF
jgi:hypothetical protein